MSDDSPVSPDNQSQPPDYLPTGSATREGLVAAAGLMVIAIFLSAVTGLIRVMVLARQFGTTGEINAYVQAFRVPDFIYFLMAGGALRTGFVPVFTEYLTLGKHKQAWRTFSSTLWLLMIVGILLVGLGIIFAPQLAVLVGPGWAADNPELLSLCERLMRIMFPAEIFFVIGGLLMGTLNAQKHFFWPAAGPIVYNIIVITGILLAPVLWGLPTVSYAVVLGALLGSLLLQIPPLRQRGARLLLSFNISDEGMRRVIKLALPVVFGLAIAEINLIITTALATQVDPLHGATILEYANRLWKLPTRMFGAGIAIALFPTLAEHYAKDDVISFRRDFSFGLRNTLFLAVPSAVGIMVLRQPLIRLLFEGRVFSARDTQAVGQALFWYGLGIVGLSALYIVARAFYARHDTVTPVWVGAISVAACVVAALALMPIMGVSGLALATSISAIVNTVILMWLLRKQVGSLDGARILRSQVNLLPPTAALGIVCWLTMTATQHYLGTAGLTARLADLLVPLILGTGTFIGLSALLQVEEMHSAWRLVKRRLTGRPNNGAGDEASTSSGV